MEMQHSNEETLAMELSDSRSTRHQETTVIQNVSGEVAISAHHVNLEEENA
ncbi:hypothetical protein TSUD_267050 [Trifolium subterraneum]|uniref:Uncharacterized protein n=1 Tax=Trifolium subterraneum TaxID=3900 RepID=A0A2Z6MSE6_TRISU|nr:hypothetical protein TSUD_267050 [Trifolium subterraneum]